jgi:two-component system nitrate/nitrite response regulator NarP
MEPMRLLAVLLYDDKGTGRYMASVIIADDHPLMLVGVEAVLTASGHTISAQASNGEAALAAAGDLFLVDLKMPGGSGLDVLRNLRDRKDDRPLILLTGSIDTGSLREALALGINGVVLKSSASAQLVMCIEQVLAGQRWLDPSLMDQAMAAQAPADENVLTQLSPRDQSIVRLVVSGLRNRDIGERLGMTEGNVKVTLHRIYERLSVANRVELAMLARDAMDAMAAA